jgi:drug/metabolite transporter (DMT)-like permease
MNLLPTNSSHKTAFLQLHLAVFLWGFTGVLGRAISVDEYALVLYRILITCAILFGLLVYKKQWQRLPISQLKNIMIIGCLIAIHWVAFYGSIKKANASIALICLSTASIYTAVLEPIFSSKKWSLLELVCSFLAIAGMCCIYTFESQYSLGILFGLFAACLSAIFTILNKKVVNNQAVQLLVFYELGTGFVLLLLLAPLYNYFFPQLHILPTKMDYLWLLLLSYFCTVLGQSLALKSLQKLSSFTVVLAVNLEPVYGIALAFIFYKEQKDLSIGFYIGIALIAASVLLHSIFAFRLRKKEVG